MSARPPRSSAGTVAETRRPLLQRLRSRAPKLSRTALAGVTVATLAGAWLLGKAVVSLYVTPKREAEVELTALASSVAALESRLQETARVNRGLRDVAARTLGGDRESVDHRLRTRLNRIVEAIGLEEATVGTGRSSARLSPARSQFKGRSRRELRDEIDFVELEGFASGNGTFEQALRLVDAIVTEPWIKRIDQVRLEPDANADRFDVTVRLATMFLPDREPEEVPQGAESPGSTERFAALIASNPFRLPPPEQIAQAAPEPEPAAVEPQRFPWGQWALSGVAESPAGPEAWLRNRTSGETRVLAVGQRIDDAQLVAVEIDTVQFEVDGRRFRIGIGETLRDRRPLP